MTPYERRRYELIRSGEASFIYKGEPVVFLAFANHADAFVMRDIDKQVICVEWKDLKDETFTQSEERAARDWGVSAAIEGRISVLHCDQRVEVVATVEWCPLMCVIENCDSGDMSVVPLKTLRYQSFCEKQS